MKPFQLLALFLALGCAQAPAQDNQTVPQPAAPATQTSGAEAEQEAIMTRIEREIRLPAGAAPLASYARFYAWQEREDGRRKVIGVWLGAGERTPGRRWATENEFPLILDGGCGLVTLSYDADAQRIEHVTCNGDA
ncbi:MAG TPA: hypothetical protein VEC11_01200 [Allosphingosinicella sp.]|nr:hypothetical protein [Allosphingosinicella sp.]